MIPRNTDSIHLMPVHVQTRDFVQMSSNVYKCGTYLATSTQNVAMHKLSDIVCRVWMSFTTIHEGWDGKHEESTVIR